MLAVPNRPDPLATDLDAARAAVRATLAQVRQQAAKPDSRYHKVRTTLQRKAVTESSLELPQKPAPEELGPEDTHPPDYAEGDASTD